MPTELTPSFPKSFSSKNNGFLSLIYIEKIYTWFAAGLNSPAIENNQRFYISKIEKVASQFEDLFLVQIVT